MSLIASPDPEWPAMAVRYADHWRGSVPGVIAVHHIGSTSVPGLPAKPVIDLLPVFASEEDQRSAQNAVESLGYEWLGAFGLPERTYARLDDSETGARLVQAHGYVKGSAEITRHLAFRDALRDNGALRAAYTSVKAACAARHPQGGAEYQDCKSGWIKKAESRALERMT